MESGASISVEEGVGVGMMIAGKPTDANKYYGGYISFCAGVSLEGHYTITHTCPTNYPIENLFDLYNLLKQKF